jgi:hypothetical protein
MFVIDRIQSVLKQLLEILFGDFGLPNHKFSKFVQNLIKLDIVLVLGQRLIITQTVP